jgi:sugar O-acyltransferase (sialic acid O-acetyltransferase NeuD family)
MIPIILIGGGGHCKSVIDVIESTNTYNIIGIIDKPEKIGETINGYTVIASDNEIPKYIAQNVQFIITVGQINISNLRKNIFENIVQLGGILPTIIASTAKVSKNASIAQGTVIMHHALVNANAVIAQNCIINTAAIIEHDVQVGSNVHISTGAILNGGCIVNEGCFVGSHATVLQGITVHTNSIIAAGAVVTKQVETNTLYAGVPAVFKKNIH